MNVSRLLVLALAVVSIRSYAPTTNKPPTGNLSSPFQNAVGPNVNLRAAQDADHTQARNEAVTGPFRWVCVSTLKDRVKGKAVSVETKGNIGASCDEVQKQALQELSTASALKKAGNTDILPVARTVRADQADTFCRKEEFLTSCQ